MGNAAEERVVMRGAGGVVMREGNHEEGPPRLGDGEGQALVPAAVGNARGAARDLWCVGAGGVEEPVENVKPMRSVVSEPPRQVELGGLLRGGGGRSLDCGLDLGKMGGDVEEGRGGFACAVVLTPVHDEAPGGHPSNGFF